MRERRQNVLFLFLSLALSAFLIGHSLIVQIDFESCFETLAESVNGGRPHPGVAEMSFGRLAIAAGRAISADQLVIGILGLLPLSPFWIAWGVSRAGPSRKLWIVAAILAVIVIVCWIFTMGPTEFHDCDRKGVSLGILLAPIMYTAMTLAATLALALLRSVFPSATGRE